MRPAPTPRPALAARLAPVATLLLLLAAAPARADEAPRWKLDSALARYQLELTRQPPSGNQSGIDLPGHLVLAQDGLHEGRRPLRGLAHPGDLVWHYALLVPESDGTSDVLDRLPVQTRPEGRLLQTQGTHQVRRRGPRTVIRTQLSYTPEGWNQPAGPGVRVLKGGTLLVERAFNHRAGRLEQAQFALTVVYEVDGQTETYPFEGRIQPGPDLDAGSRDFGAQVQQAIERAVAWLEPQVSGRMRGGASGHYSLGYVALGAFALLRSGVAPQRLDPVFEWMAQQPLEETYSVSLYVMALEARFVQRTPIPPRAGLRSVARFERGPIPPAAKAQLERAVGWLLAVRKEGEGWWSYGGAPLHPDGRLDRLAKGPTGHDGKTAATSGDRSNSQFAVLALHSALACGVEVPAAVWEELLAEFEGGQETDGPAGSVEGSEWQGHSPFAPAGAAPAGGETRERDHPGTVERLSGKQRGWSYGTGRLGSSGAGYGSMTAAGVSSLAVVREGLKLANKLDAARDRKLLEAVRDGLCWLEGHWDPARNPLSHGWYYYYAYSVEKAMDTSGVERLGSHEWWRELSAELLARQRPDGSWEGTLDDTALALLVLNRATLPAQVKIEAIARVATGQQVSWDLAVIPGTGQVHVRELLASLLHSPAREIGERLALAEKALEALDAGVRPGVVPDLAALLAHEHRGVKRFAERGCRDLAGSVDPAALQAFGRDWEAIQAAGEALDHERIPELRVLLRDEARAVQLRRAAVLTLARLRAYEAVSDMLLELQGGADLDYRRFVWTTVVSMTGRGLPEVDAAASPTERRRQVDAARAWWTARIDERLLPERVRRAVSDLARTDRAEAAAARLREIGRPAVRGLLDGLRVEASKARAHALLRQITGANLPADPGPWMDWADRNGL